MRAVKLGVLLLAAVVLTLLLTGIFLDRHYVVERSIVVDAPADVVWSHVGDVRRQAAWSPWRAADPTIEATLEGDGVSVGSVQRWTSEHSGSGAFTLVALDPPRRLDATLVLDGQGEADVTVELAPSGTGTRVTWRLEGDVDTVAVGGWIAATMDGLVGPSLEDGLGRLSDLATTPGGAP